MQRTVLTTVVAFVLAFAPTFGFAQDSDSSQTIEDTDPIKITGDVHAPEAFYILNNQQLEFEETSDEKTFVPELLNSTDDEAL